MSDQRISEQELAAKGREIEAAQWHLPEKFALDPALIALSPEEFQKANPEMFALWTKVQAQEKEWAAAANTAHGRPSAPDLHRARAVQRAEELRVDIERTKALIDVALTSGGDTEIAELQAALLALKHRRAEHLATIGRYDLAASEEPDPQYRDHYLAILEAVHRDDPPDSGDICDCPPHRGSGEHAGLDVSQIFVKEEVFSLRHGKVAFLLKCGDCGLMNVVPDLPRHLAEARGHRARAHQLAGRLSISDAAKALSSQNLTTAKLLGIK